MSLNDREKIIVTVVAMTIVLFLAFQMVIKPIKEELKSLSKKIDVTKNNFEELTKLGKEYKAGHDSVKAMEESIANSSKDVSLPSILENLVNAADLKKKMTGLKSSDTLKSSNFQENGVEVTLKEISIDELIDFTYRLESLPYIIKIKSFKIKTTYAKDLNPKYINLTLAVSLFTPI